MPVDELIATGLITGTPLVGAPLEATTNLITNPSFETGTASWSHLSDGTGPTFERSALATWIGSYGLRWVLGSGTTTTPYILIATGAPTQGVTYTASIRVKGVGTAIGKQFYLRLEEFGGTQANAITSSSPIVLTGDWQLFTVSRTVVQADRTKLNFMPRYYAYAAAGNEVYVDGAQVEAKAYPTPYCDGSLGAYHTWTGTPHASTSVRSVGPDAPLISQVHALTPTALLAGAPLLSAPDAAVTSLRGAIAASDAHKYHASVADAALFRVSVIGDA